MLTTWSELNNRIVTCQKCPRLINYCHEVATTRRRAYREQVYWGKPVPGFGDVKARVLVVGLAPGAHGSNRTGRMFTGDASGAFLCRALYKAGFANQADSKSRDDRLNLRDIFISAVCRCAPPDNKPAREEINNCLPYLHEEISLLINIKGIVCLGKIALDGVLQLYNTLNNPYPRVIFSHGGYTEGDERHPWLLTSFHPSQQNTQTGRLTEAMFDNIWRKVNQLLSC